MLTIQAVSEKWQNKDILRCGVAVLKTAETEAEIWQKEDKKPAGAIDVYRALEYSINDIN